MSKTKLPFEAVGYRIIIEIEDPMMYDETTRSAKKAGIIISDKELKREQVGAEKGVVVSIGEEAYEDMPRPWIKLGDTVYFQRYEGISPEDFKIDDKIYRVINDKDVFARATKD